MYSSINTNGADGLPILCVTTRGSGRSDGTLETMQCERRGGEAKGGSLNNAVRTVVEDDGLWWQLRVRR
jgi:hypothetical protein